MLEENAVTLLKRNSAHRVEMGRCPCGSAKSPREFASTHPGEVDVGKNCIEGPGRVKGKTAFSIEDADDLVPTESEVSQEAL